MQSLIQGDAGARSNASISMLGSIQGDAGARSDLSISKLGSIQGDAGARFNVSNPWRARYKEMQGPGGCGVEQMVMCYVTWNTHVEADVYMSGQAVACKMEGSMEVAWIIHVETRGHTLGQAVACKRERAARTLPGPQHVVARRRTLKQVVASGYKLERVGCKLLRFPRQLLAGIRAALRWYGRDHGMNWKKTGQLWTFSRPRLALGGEWLAAAAWVRCCLQYLETG
eukprot:scaffold41564_cov24-Tisochrysis_lutea.AAC.1